MFAAAFMVLLAACQTVPQQGGFSREQVALLEREGFRRVGENYELGLNNRVLFNFDRSDLQPEMVEMLGRLGGILLDVGIHGASIEGHADAIGDAAYNHRLSEERALAVKARLVGAGMPPNSVRAYGVGEKEPIDSNGTETGRQQNRRVVIVVAPADALPL
ncbi:MAG: OmpA family protein [Erythrobacter sp.]|jgi:OOP family OmpA-OmpF porin